MSRFFSKVELRIALSYAFFGAFWVLLTDKLVAVLSVDIATLSRIQTYKGWAFVAASTLLIYYLLRYDRRHKQSNEKELNETQTRLRSVLDNAPIVLISVDRNGVFTLSEGAGLERTGLKPGQVVGQSAYDLYGSFPIFLPNGTAISGDDLLNRVYNGETIIAHTELNGVHFENRFAPLRKRDGTVDGLVGVAIDITQRNQFEDDLRKAEAQYRTLVEQIPPIVYLTSPNQYMGVNYISPRINTLGFTQEEWVADPELWFRQIHPEDQKRVLDEIEQIKQNDAEGIKRNAEAFKLEYRLISRDGIERWYLDEVLNVFDDHGELLFRQGIMLDITERKQAEEKIAHQANLLANVNDAILASDEKFLLTAWNNAAEKMYGWMAEEVIGKSGTEILQTEFLTISRPEAIQRLMETGEFFAEVSQLRKDGTKIHIETRTTALRDVNGKTTGYITVNRDITERKRVEETLQISQQMYSKIFDSNPVPIGVGEISSGRFINVNKSYADFFGYTREELIGKSAVSLWADPTQREVVTAKLVESGSIRNCEVQFRRKTGEIREGLLFMDVVPIGEVPTLIAMIVDINDRKRAEEEVRLSRDRLAGLSRRLVEAHENEKRAIARELHDQIGQILTALKLTLEVASQLPPEPAAKKFAQAQGLVNDLLNRVSHISLELRPPMLDDLGLIPALLWHINRYQEQTNIAVDFKHSGAEGERFDPEIETTAYRIVQESLTNVARHAHATRARLEVRLISSPKGSGERMEIQIEDNGIGFDPQAAFGLNRGLDGMRERVNLVGGSFHIESQPGTGTKKFIQLPLREKAT